MTRTLAAIVATIPILGCQDNAGPSRIAAPGESASGEISVHQEQGFSCFEKSFKAHAVSFESDRNGDGAIIGHIRYKTSDIPKLNPAVCEAKRCIGPHVEPIAECTAGSAEPPNSALDRTREE